MFRIGPGRRWRIGQHTLEQAGALEAGSPACYLLTLDEKVQMGRDVARGRLVLPEDDALAEMYDVTRSFLASKGYAPVRDLELGAARPGKST